MENVKIVSGVFYYTSREAWDTFSSKDISQCLESYIYKITQVRNKWGILNHDTNEMLLTFYLFGHKLLEEKDTPKEASKVFAQALFDAPHLLYAEASPVKERIFGLSFLKVLSYLYGEHIDIGVEAYPNSICTENQLDVLYAVEKSYQPKDHIRLYFNKEYSLFNPGLPNDEIETRINHNLLCHVPPIDLKRYSSKLFEGPEGEVYFFSVSFNITLDVEVLGYYPEQCCTQSIYSFLYDLAEDYSSSDVRVRLVRRDLFLEFKSLINEAVKNAEKAGTPFSKYNLNMKKGDVVRITEIPSDWRSHFLVTEYADEEELLFLTIEEISEYTGELLVSFPARPDLPLQILRVNSIDHIEKINMDKKTFLKIKDLL